MDMEMWLLDVRRRRSEARRLQRSPSTQSNVNKTTHTIKTFTYLVDVIHNTIDDLSLERLEHDRPVLRYELCLTVPPEDHAFSDIEDGDYGDDVPELTGTCSFDVGV
jgi:hypothetical protein